MSAKRILVVDDDSNVLELIRLYLTSDGFEVITVDDGAKVRTIFDQMSPDLILLDLMLPGCDGWEICRSLRKVATTPIIILSARDEDSDKILGLELGADDYITKPFNPKELIARVRAVLRRTESPLEHDERVLEYPGIIINQMTRQVQTLAGEAFPTAKEFDLLWFLASQPGWVFTRSQILDRVWGYEYLGDSRTVDTHIKRLRRKLRQNDQNGWRIETVWGVGYRFEVDDR